MARFTFVSTVILSFSSSAIALSLPPATGKHPTGTISIPLTDYSRLDPSAPSPTPRSFMVQLFYPTAHTTTHPLAPYASPQTATFYDTNLNLTTGSMSSITTNSYTNAPITPHTSIPVIVFTHGYGMSHIMYTTYYEDLASHGYLVLAIDHPYDSPFVEFPDGRVIAADLPMREDPEFFANKTDVRVKDTQYLLDRLYTNLTEGIPGVRGKRLRVKGVGMFGHSLGGGTVAGLMCVDRRVGAGMTLDGGIDGDAAETGGFGAPFVFMGTPMHNLGTDKTWENLWGRLWGWRTAMVLAESTHGTYTDLGYLAEANGMPRGELEFMFGKIKPIRAVEVVRAYIRGFFDFALKGAEEGLLGGPTPEYPEISFQSWVAW